jgi:hypothetical protein
MDRKDVGILAMDIYFPPTCVQQVKLLFLPPSSMYALRYCSSMLCCAVNAVRRPAWV